MREALSIEWPLSDRVQPQHKGRLEPERIRDACEVPDQVGLMANADLSGLPITMKWARVFRPPAMKDWHAA